MRNIEPNFSLFTNEPYYINPDNGLEWYIEDGITKWCSKDIQGCEPLKAIGFIVAIRINGNLKPISYVVISTETNEIVAENQKLEDICFQIDILRLIKKN
jgi:hypothetical protein